MFESPHAQDTQQQKHAFRAPRGNLVARLACVLALGMLAVFLMPASLRGRSGPFAGPSRDLARSSSSPLRTPLPEGLYPYPEQRVGFVAFRRDINFSSLNAGFVKLEDRGPTAYERSLGADFCTVIREDTEHWELPDPATYWAKIAGWVTANPGHLWFLGNEPDNPCRFGTFSGEYVQRYHKLYTFIKERDPTAQVGIGGVVLPSQLRRTWLERVLSAYQSRYGVPMPIDVWNVHALLLSECPGPCQPTDPNPCDPALRCSGGYVPRELWCQKGLYYSEADQARSDEFIRLVREFRQWMKDRGFQNKPLIVTEMGVLTWLIEGSCARCFPHDDINRFMFETFDFMMNAKDTGTGYPADGYRLVQRWTWYSMDDTNFNGALLDPGSGYQRTDYGLNFANYVARFLPTSPTTIFFQRGWTGYTEDADTTLRPGTSSPGGSSLWIAADGTQKALLQFDVSVLPTDLQVVSATLSLVSLYHQNVGDMTVNCYGIRRPWDVGTATWLNATASTPWEGAGCTGPSDRGGLVSSALVVAEQEMYSWDVTELARAWVADPASNHGVVLEASGGGSGYWTFAASNQAEFPPYELHKLRPKLELMVGLRPPTPTPTATPTRTRTPTPTPIHTATKTPAVNHPPENHSIWPSSGGRPAGRRVNFSTTYRDLDGWRDLKQVILHIGNTRNQRSNCRLMYNVARNKLYLLQNDGTGWLGGFAPGTAKVIRNRQCTLNCSRSTVEKSGRTVTVKWNLLFTASFRGRKRTWMRCTDRSGGVAPWQAKGTWIVR